MRQTHRVVADSVVHRRGALHTEEASVAESAAKRRRMAMAPPPSSSCSTPASTRRCRISTTACESCQPATRRRRLLTDSEPDLDLAADHPKEVSSVPAQHGVGAARPSNASERPKTRHRQASLIGAVDATLCLPGRIWLETKKVGLQAHRVYLWVRSLLASWAVRLVTSAMVVAYLLVRLSWEALIFI